MCLDGEIVYDQRWLRRDLRRLRLEKIGFIFQTHNLLPFLTATENVMEVMELSGVSPAAARARAFDLLNYLEVGHRRDAMPNTLSGGEAQRVAIARALANGPRIILADEPTAPLDSQRAGIVMDLLRRLATDQQAAILVVTHDENLFDRLDHIFRLRDGRLVTDDDGGVKSKSLDKQSPHQLAAASSTTPTPPGIRIASDCVGGFEPTKLSR
jgi:putative ABC transport system ATP-binding protein